METSNSNKWEVLQETLAQMKFLRPENPVILSLKNRRLTPNQGIKVLQQYYYLVVTIVQFLTIAMVRIPVAKVKKELRRNLDEELGSKTGGISHQELLETLLRRELGIEVRTEWKETTNYFITSMLVDFNIQPPHYVAGMIYALEATACPELLVVAEIINLAAQKQVVDIAKLSGSGEYQDQRVNSLQDFLAAHTLGFELGHESGLRTTLEEFASKNWREFECGFNNVLGLMEIWWNRLGRP